ncbi:YwqG family protein [Bhargavaea beijingensis]|uniref:YwqG family protein n=1 Tax=Bhargavaea beijingensis TaxID=426756 RepID=UPI002225245C|nr:YwqG family protein [Bhargavaea beijingensis]MCW1928691.1 YwqG family protein [Bhargavaea beijingensis]
MKTWRENLEANGLAEFIAPLSGLAKPGFALAKEDAAGTLAPGASKFGGAPDLPPDMEPPSKDGKPLTLIAQLNLSDAALAGNARPLPASGVLSFFYDTEEQPWGGEEGDRSGWKVLYFEDPADLERREVPEEVMLPEFAASFRAQETLDTDAVFDMDFDDETGETIFELLEEGAPHHRVLGHPFAVQNPVFTEVAHYCGGVADWDEAEKAAEDYVLLLQMDSDDDLDAVWGDLGMLYFCIRKDDLAEKRFDRTQMVMQCS